MKTVDVQGHGVVAIGFSVPSPNIQSDGCLNESFPATQKEEGIEASNQPTGVVVEVLRRLGGVAPRALVGGVFQPDNGHVFCAEILYGVGASSASGDCPSSLWKCRLTAGLPLEFARGVASGLTTGGGSLPAGRLRVEYAGYDEVESSAIVFAQAASVLRSVVVARLRGLDVDAAVRDVISDW